LLFLSCCVTCVLGVLEFATSTVAVAAVADGVANAVAVTAAAAFDDGGGSRSFVVGAQFLLSSVVRCCC
jgi:hypothetical protein